VNALKELYDQIEDHIYEYKFKRGTMSSCTYQIKFDKEVLQLLCLGHAWILKEEEGLELGRYIRKDNQKIRKIRRYDDYEGAGYDVDPYEIGKRIKARVSSECKSEVEDLENYKENFFLLGINGHKNRSIIFEEKLAIEMTILQTKKFKEIIKKLDFIPIQIDYAGEIGCNLSYEDLGDIFEKLLNGKIGKEGISEFKN
jgi:hypothetical protein